MLAAMADVADMRERVAGVCLALPEATREPSGRHDGYRVRGRTFAYFMDDHQGDGMVVVAFKAGREEGQALLASDPGRFRPTAYLHHRGWVSLRLDLGPVDPSEVGELVTESYLLVAPRRLAALVPEPPSPDA